MKAYLSLHLAAILSCSLLASSCQKESDNIKPAPAAALVSSNAMPVNHPVYLAVGSVYNHYPVLTGATGNYYIAMTLASKHVTPQSIMEKWESNDVVPEQNRPLDDNSNPVKLPYKFRGETTVGLGDGKVVVITSQTTWERDGTVNMMAKSVYSK